MMAASGRHLVNLDYAASTPLRAEAVSAQAAHDASPLAGANPNSLHTLGRMAASEMEDCRRAIASTFGARVRPSEVIFTGGGTEANVLALLGISQAVRAREPKRTRVIVSAIEHDSILDNIALLKSDGFSVDLVRPCAAGYVEPETLASCIGDDVALVSIMFANNETGVIQPISELARIAHSSGALFHTDAIQGWLHAPFDVHALGVDACSVAGHKIGGPVGVGALYLKSRTPIAAQSHGGGQERGLRPGTQDLRSLVAFRAAAMAVFKTVESDRERVQGMADNLYRKVCEHPKISASMGDPLSVDRLPGIVSILVEDMDSEELILQLDGRGYEVSAGSACSSGSLDASHVLRAMGVPRELALGALRISFDDRVEQENLDGFANALFEVVDRR